MRENTTEKHMKAQEKDDSLERESQESEAARDTSRERERERDRLFTR